MEGDHSIQLAQISCALGSGGFFLIRNCRKFPPSRMRKCLDYARQFYDILGKSHSIQESILPAGLSFRGYVGPGYSGQDNTVPSMIDWKESWDIGPPALGSKSGDPRYAIFTGEGNRWIEDELLPGFRDFMQSYLADIMELQFEILDIIGRSIGLDQNEIAKKCCFEAIPTLKLIHYWPQPNASPIKDQETDRFYGKLDRPPEVELDHNPSLIGIGEHRDYGLLTILLQDEVGGLEAKLPDGSWVPITPIEGTFVINVGNMLSRMSGGRLKSAFHRVVNRASGVRHSCACFLEPSFDVLVHPSILFPGDKPEGSVETVREHETTPESWEFCDDYGLVGDTCGDILFHLFKANGRLADERFDDFCK